MAHTSTILALDLNAVAPSGNEQQNPDDSVFATLVVTREWTYWKAANMHLYLNGYKLGVIENGLTRQFLFSPSPTNTLHAEIPGLSDDHKRSNDFVFPASPGDTVHVKISVTGELVTSVLTLGGATSIAIEEIDGEEPTPTSSPLTDEIPVGRVHIYRPNNWHGGMMDYELALDNALVASVPNEAYTVCDIPAGEYKIGMYIAFPIGPLKPIGTIKLDSFGFEEEGLYFRIEPDQEYYLKFTTIYTLLPSPGDGEYYFYYDDGIGEPLVMTLMPDDKGRSEITSELKEVPCALTETAPPDTPTPIPTPTPLADPVLSAYDQMSDLTYPEFERHYDSLGWLDRSAYEESLIGLQVHWTGEVLEIDDGRVRINVGQKATYRFVYLTDLSANELQRLAPGQTIEFTAEISQFVWFLGLDTYLRNVELLSIIK